MIYTSKEYHEEYLLFSEQLDLIMFGKQSFKHHKKIIIKIFRFRSDKH